MNAHEARKRAYTARAVLGGMMADLLRSNLDYLPAPISQHQVDDVTVKLLIDRDKQEVQYHFSMFESEVIWLVDLKNKVGRPIKSSGSVSVRGKRLIPCLTDVVVNARLGTTVH